MKNKPNAFLDEHDEEYMYPLPGESDADFEKRLDILRKRRHASMTEEERRIATALANGTLSEAELEKLKVYE